jgi:hypothetical protein
MNGKLKMLEQVAIIFLVVLLVSVLVGVIVGINDGE